MVLRGLTIGSLPYLFRHSRSLRMLPQLIAVDIWLSISSSITTHGFKYCQSAAAWPRTDSNIANQQQHHHARIQILPISGSITTHGSKYCQSVAASPRTDPNIANQRQHRHARIQIFLSMSSLMNRWKIIIVTKKHWKWEYCKTDTRRLVALAQVLWPVSRIMLVPIILVSIS